MTLSLLFGGSSTYRLIHDGLDVGWLAGDALVFTGFDSLAEAERASDAGYVALLDWFGGAGDASDEERMRIHVAIDENDVSEWIGPNGKALARIIQPAEDEGFVVEFALPRSVHTVAAARVASRMFDAMHATTRGAWPRAGRGERRTTMANS
jgi:hypothetical protein